MENAFLQIIRKGIGTPTLLSLPRRINWNELGNLANQHGILAIFVDGIEMLPETYRPPQDTLLQWIGVSLQEYEYRYEQYCRAIS